VLGFAVLCCVVMLYSAAWVVGLLGWLCFLCGAQLVPNHAST
jgi:hypothetical protein